MLKLDDAMTKARMPTRVLIADDEPAIVRSTRSILEAYGYEIETCDEAGQILARIEAWRPDLVLQDVRMPGLDLERLVMALRADARWKRLPVVLFTASMEAEEVGARVGAAAVIDKPFKPNDLVRVIETALAARA